MLETDFVDALAKAPQHTLRFNLYDFPYAMCALDLERALQMFDACNIVNTGNPGMTVSPEYIRHQRQQLMQYILMTREERVFMPLF